MGPRLWCWLRAVLAGSFHVPESAECSGPFYLWVAVLCWRACPFSTSFSRASLTAPLAECARMCRGNSGMGGGVGGVGGEWMGKKMGILTFEERGPLSALFWLWCSTYLRCSVGGNQREGSKGSEEMSQNSYTNDWNRTQRFILQFMILTHGIQSNRASKMYGRTT